VITRGGQYGAKERTLLKEKHIKKKIKQGLGWDMEKYKGKVD
jgi:hypothetical protein